MRKRSRGSASATIPLPKRSRAGGLVGSATKHVSTPPTQTATEGWLASVQQEILVATYWFDPGDQGEPHSATICFSGRRVGSAGKPQRRDTFTQEETVDDIIPGSGPVSVTARVSGINPGEWLVTAGPVTRRNRRSPVVESSGPSRGFDSPVGRTIWPWRTAPKLARVESPVKTALAPFARIPGVVPAIYFAWPALIGLGVLIGLATQGILIARAHGLVSAALLVSLASVAAGCVGAKIWYVAVHRAQQYDGWCIQGFVLGAALVAGTLPVPILKMPVGTFLDAAAPGLFFGMFIGRPGCFLVGCCAGRPTASRWGLWSSDRRVGMRRVPTQLLEALLCFTIGVVALTLILERPPARPGAIFLGALAAYTLGRQFLFPLRAESRKTSVGRPLTMGAAALVLVADIVISAVP